MSTDREILFMPGKLWSLWEVLFIDGGKLVLSVEELAGCVAVLNYQSEGMPADFQYRWLSDALASVDHFAHLSADRKVRGIKKHVEESREVLNRLLDIDPGSDKSNPLFAIRVHWLDILSLRECFKNTLLIVQAHLEGQVFLQIRPEHSQYWDDSGQLASEFFSEFPDSVTDLEEAYRCFALGRYTASVFHFMRAAESAVGRMASEIDVTVTNKNGETLPWGQLVSEIKKKIDAMPKGKSKDQWYKIHALMHSCNRAYRTKTAHPEDFYNEEQAETVMNTTYSFIKEMFDLL